MKDLARFNPDVLPEDTPPDRALRYVDIGGVDGLGRMTGWEETVFEKAPSRARRLALPRDIVVSTVRTYLRAIAMVPDDARDLVFSTGFAVLRPITDLVYPEFLWRALQAEPYVQWIVSHSDGIGYPAINPSELGQLKVALPPLVQQRGIAAFLDRETARIDTLIAKKERLLGLLEEKRTALITRAVTKGLDPAVPMKESGVEWLGEVPAHWEVRRLKQISSVGNSGAYGLDPGEADLDLPVCTTAHITPDGHLLTANMPLRAFSEAEVARYVAKPGDILVVKSSGSNTNIISGKLALVTDLTPRLVFSNFLMRLRPSPKAISPAFLAYLLRSALTRERIRRMVATTTYPNVDVPEYVGSSLAVPPRSEQEAIVAYLDRETAKINALVAKIGEAIALLREYRTALISAAVTGQIDVSGGMREVGR